MCPLKSLELHQDQPSGTNAPAQHGAFRAPRPWSCECDEIHLGDRVGNASHRVAFMALAFEW
jgi:hypothetical protein